jgi:uncharacterized membrane protein
VSVGWAFVTAILVISMVGSLAAGWWVYRRLFSSDERSGAASDG